MTGMLRLLRSILGIASCTTIWGSSVARQKAKSCTAYTTLSRGGPHCVGINKYDFSHDQFSFSTSHSMIATHLFEMAHKSILPLWLQTAKAQCLAPDALAPEIFVFLHGMLFTNIQLDDFSATLTCLLECLDIEEPKGQEWTMMAAVNIGALLEYGWTQGVLQCTSTLSQIDHNPATIAAATKVKLARKVQVDDQMEVDSNERRQSGDIEAVHPQSPSVIHVSPILSDTMASLEPPPAFKMAQELTFTMLAHALRSTRDGPNLYVTIILTFLQTVLQHPEGLAMLECAIPWA